MVMAFRNPILSFLGIIARMDNFVQFNILLNLHIFLENCGCSGRPNTRFGCSGRVSVDFRAAFLTGCGFFWLGRRADANPASVTLMLSPGTFGGEQ
jgi:hypothetical protein